MGYTTIEDHVGRVNPLSPPRWVRLLSNGTGGVYVSEGPSDQVTGAFRVIGVPGDTYTMQTGPGPVGPWTTVDASYSVNFFASNPATTGGAVIGKGGLNYNVKEYGAKGDGATDVNGVAVSGSAAISTTTSPGPWTAADVGKPISFALAGPAGGMLSTTIASFQDAQHITLATTAGASVNSAGNTGWGTDDTVAIQAAINAAQTALGGTVFFPRGTYLISSPLLIANAVRGDSIVLEGAATSPGIDASGNPRPNNGACIAPVGSYTSGQYLIIADATNSPSNIIIGLDIKNLFLNCRAGALTQGLGLSAGINCVGVWDMSLFRVNVAQVHGIGIRVVQFAPTTGNSNWIYGCTVTCAALDAASVGFEFAQFESAMVNCCALNCDTGFLLSDVGANPTSDLTNCIADGCNSWGFRIVNKASLTNCRTFGMTRAGANIRLEGNDATIIGGEYVQSSNVNGNVNVSDSTGHTSNVFIGVRFTGSSGGTLTAAVYSGGAGTALSPVQFIGCVVTNPARYTTLWSVSGDPGGGFRVAKIGGYNPANRTALTAGASVFTYTNNDFYPEMLVITAINGLTAVAYKGVAGGSIAVGVPYYLNPGDTIAMTWATTAPVYAILPVQ